ncbi:MAG: hypothetical protein OHK0029_28700 [Armatimonadaceae bacterium]
MKTLQRRQFMTAGAAFLALGWVVGCGGSGGSSGGGGINLAESRSVDVFITDGFDERFRQVWITLYQVEVSADNGQTWSTAYSAPDTVGLPLNLLSLRDRAQFLGAITLPEGNFNALRVTFGDTVTVSEPGSDDTREILVESGGNIAVADGKAVVTLNPPRPVLARGERRLVMDFDVAAFEFIGGKVRPVIQPFAPPDFALRELRAELPGTVQNLRPDAGAFDLLLRGSREMRVGVSYKPDTLISRRGEGDAPLTEGARVLVRGTWEPGMRRMNADSIRILPEGVGERPDMERPERRAFAGQVTGIHAEGKVFALDLWEAGLRPGSAFLRVVTSDDTAYRVRQRDAGEGSFESLSVGAKVVVFGEPDRENREVRAERVEILPNRPELPPLPPRPELPPLPPRLGR